MGPLFLYDIMQILLDYLVCYNVTQTPSFFVLLLMLYPYVSFFFFTPMFLDTDLLVIPC